MAEKVWLEKVWLLEYGCKSMAATKLYRPITKQILNAGKPIKKRLGACWRPMGIGSLTKAPYYFRPIRAQLSLGCEPMTEAYVPPITS